jgi:hypothetical protein
VKAREDDGKGDEKLGRFFAEGEADAGKRVGAEIRGEQDEEDRTKDREDPRTYPESQQRDDEREGHPMLP